MVLYISPVYDFYFMTLACALGNFSAIKKKNDPVTSLMILCKLGDLVVGLIPFICCVC